MVILDYNGDGFLDLVVLFNSWIVLWVVGFENGVIVELGGVQFFFEVWWCFDSINLLWIECVEFEFRNDEKISVCVQL